ncbi:fibronectin type III domain-containing protein [Kribbella sp. CA-247076]|uniref:fibronectin type III domain-containing protein n=1 Tax=Kribbella sp. CA-247076 TaxID=3239941 RepID=UPI003D90C67A
MKRIFRIKGSTAAERGGTAERGGSAWRSRAALAGVVAVCMTATALAITGAGADTAGMKFVQSGHLIYNSTLGTVFHVDGGTKNVDGQVQVPGLGAGAKAVQTDTQGFVLARGSITEFGKSDLQVADPRPAPSEEQPTALEAPGAAFAVYRKAGAISRLGAEPVTISVPGALGHPVVTAHGTLWVHRITSRELCQLPVDADRLSCPAEVGSGHAGALTVVEDRVVFVDTTARELRTLDADGFGRTVPIPGTRITPESLIAPYDVKGRIAIVEPARNELHLVDAALTGDRTPAAPVVQKLPAGKYSQVASSGTGVALIDESSNTLVTLDADGRKKAARPIPAPSKKGSGKAERPELFRGADKRLYVDNASGEHTMVVDDDGEVTGVEARDPREPGDGKRPPETPPTTPPSAKTSTPPSTPPSRKPTAPLRTGEPERTGGPEGENRPVRPRRTPPPETNNPPKTVKPRPTTTPKPKPSPKPSPKPKPKPVKATPAGAPTGLTARAADGAVTLSWRQPNLNGGRLVHYRVTRGGSSVTTTGRSYTWSGLTNETAYTFQVRAVTRGSDGKAMNGAAATVTATPKGLGRLRIAYGEKTTKYEDSHCPEGTQDDCAFVQVAASGLEPNTTYLFRAFASGWGEIHDGGYEVETDDDGNVSKKMFHNAAVGQRIYVTATGPGGPYRSNAVTWPSG